MGQNSLSVTKKSIENGTISTIIPTYLLGLVHKNLFCLILGVYFSCYSFSSDSMRTSSKTVSVVEGIASY